jgi:predicted transcriptional regulator
MTRQLVTCRPGDELRVAERRMSAQRKSRILVTGDDGRAIGVISLSDIASRLDPMAAQTLRDVARREIVGETGKRGRP